MNWVWASCNSLELHLLFIDFWHKSAFSKLFIFNLALSFLQCLLFGLLFLIEPFMQDRNMAFRTLRVNSVEELWSFESILDHPFSEFS